MAEKKKNFSIRVTEDFHRKARIMAAREGMTLQDWGTKVLTTKLYNFKVICAHFCQECGGWELKGTRMAKIGTCEDCGRADVPILPYFEREKKDEIT